MSPKNDDFKQLSPQEWKLKVQAELAGLDYNEVLVWDTAEGIQVKPLYTKEDLGEEISPVQTQTDWKIIGNFLNDSAQDFSYLYGFKVQSDLIDEVKKLPEFLDLFFESENPIEFIQNHNFSEIKNLKYLDLDVLGNFAKTGNWYQSQEDDFAFAKKIFNENQFEKSIAIDASLYQNAGANHVQQIAIALSHAVEYLENIGAEAASKLYFKVAVGGNYFFEIAKLRALRNLWNLILKEYNSEAETYIYAETSLRNKSLLDLHNNLIRSGLEASSAVQGKADVVNVLPFDELKAATAFSEELASKQQLLLQKESYFDKFIDPVSGAYFVGNLTALMSKNALELFKNIETEGGFLKGLFDGRIQKMIQKSADKEQEAFDEGKLILIGVNKFRNPTDKIQPLTKSENPVRTQIKNILTKRLAEKIEANL
ncbi:MAG TPA: methylmalonyl-CoA mutase family protein [Moheibacter sp.]|nr:methylmalonyl-CoA mutase family protein [Moheibacter sp.]